MPFWMNFSLARKNPWIPTDRKKNKKKKKKENLVPHSQASITQDWEQRDNYSDLHAET